jgi:outer membrane protein TolC
MSILFPRAAHPVGVPPGGQAIRKGVMFRATGFQMTRWNRIGVTRAIRRLTLVAAGAVLLAGCAPKNYRQQADRVADRIIHRGQIKAFGEPEPFHIRPPSEDLRERLLLTQQLPVSFPGSLATRHIVPIRQLPDKGYLATQPAEGPVPPWLAPPGEEPLRITLEQALQIAARNSREYQTQKENVYTTALSLDLERDEFRNTWGSFLQTQTDIQLADGQDPVVGMDDEAQLQLRRLFRNGMLATANLGVNVARLLTGERGSSMGLFGDASITVPLLRGAGEFVVAEPLRQAERDVIYALYTFQRFKRSFAVQVASEYLAVLEQLDQVRNAEDNYRGLVTSTRRARRMADMGRLPEIQVDQAVQDELRARDRWVRARQSYERRLDSFKLLLGLPVDAVLALDPEELDRLAKAAAGVVGAQQATATRNAEAVAADAPITLEPPDPRAGGPFEIPVERAILLAIDHRLDLRVALGRVDDAQRKIVVAANGLLPDLTLVGNLSVGERRTQGTVDLPNSNLLFNEGRYGARGRLDLPLERTRERNVYRLSWIALERAVRQAQELEDEVKLAVRNDLRTLIEARESTRIQAQAVEVARRRVRSTELFLELGRAQIRDVLEARESLISAENALTSAIVRYRVAELEFQRDLGVLEVGPGGLWREFDPAGGVEDVTDNATI